VRAVNSHSAPLAISFRVSRISRGRCADERAEKVARLDAMRRVVRAGINATRLGVIGAEIARRGFLADHGALAAGMIGIVGLHRERMQIDVSVRAILRAKAAADAPILDDHFK
jgi:hypothetical protein